LGSILGGRVAGAGRADEELWLSNEGVSFIQVATTTQQQHYSD